MLSRRLNFQNERFCDSFSDRVRVGHCEAGTLSQKKMFCRRNLNLYVEETRSKIMDNELKTNDKGEILESEIIQDGEMDIFFTYALEKKTL